MAAIETDTASDAEMKGVMEALDSSTSVPEIYFASNTRAIRKQSFAKGKISLEPTAWTGQLLQFQHFSRACAKPQAHVRDGDSGLDGSRFDLPQFGADLFQRTSRC